MLSPSSRTWDSFESSSKTSCGGASLRFTWLKKDRFVLWKCLRLAWIARRVLPESSFFHSVTTK